MAFKLQSYLQVARGRPSTTRLAGLVVAVSLANLSYLRVWELLLHNPQSAYLTSVSYGRLDFVAALMGMLALAVVIYALINWVWHHGDRWHRAFAMVGVFIILILPLDFVRRSGGASIEAMTGFSRIFVIVSFAVALFVLSLVFRQRFWAIAFWVLAILSPYALFNIGHSVVRIVALEETRPVPVISEPPSKAVGQEPRRLVWVIFDEWDQTAIFKRRPPEVQLPVLDALVKESVTLSAAYAPAKSTMVSVPSILQGRQLSGAFPTRDSGLQVQLPGATRWQNFMEGESIVTDVMAMSALTVAMGWYHPYNRILPQSPLVQAKSYGFPAFEGIRGEGVARTMLNQQAYIALPIYGRMETRDLYLRLHEDALQAMTNPAARFIFLHYGIPHSPGIYDARKRDLTVALSGDSEGYIGNLALVDRTIGDLLAALDRSGLRSRTSLILTSDHWWRGAPWSKSDQGYPVPVIIQVGKGEQGIRAEEQFPTTNLRSIARAILAGELDDNRKVAQAVARHAVEGEIRYSKGVAEVRPTAPESGKK